MQFKDVKKNQDGVPEITPAELKENMSSLRIIDVRRPDEFDGELGHIAGAELLTLESEFADRIPSYDRKETIVFVCRSGGRSSRATQYAQILGFESVFNMEGGMLLWNKLGFPTE